MHPMTQTSLHEDITSINAEEVEIIATMITFISQLNKFENALWYRLINVAVQGDINVLYKLKTRVVPTD